MCCLLRLGSSKSNTKESDLTRREQKRTLDLLFRWTVRSIVLLSNHAIETFCLHFNTFQILQYVFFFFLGFFIVYVLSNWFTELKPACTQLQPIRKAYSSYSHVWQTFLWHTENKHEQPNWTQRWGKTNKQTRCNIVQNSYILLPRIQNVL